MVGHEPQPLLWGAAPRHHVEPCHGGREEGGVLPGARALLEARLRELAETPAALESTLTDLERWAGALRERVT